MLLAMDHKPGTVYCKQIVVKDNHHINILWEFCLNTTIIAKSNCSLISSKQITNLPLGDRSTCTQSVMYYVAKAESDGEVTLLKSLLMNNLLPEHTVNIIINRR